MCILFLVVMVAKSGFVVCHCVCCMLNVVMSPFVSDVLCCFLYFLCSVLRVCFCVCDKCMFYVVSNGFFIVGVVVCVE